MAYKISDKAILVESGGENILIAETATFERGGLTILDSDYTLSPTFVSNYFAPVFQGDVSGYASGGSPGSSTTINIIQKFPFASDDNATDVGDLTQSRGDVAGQFSDNHGYTSGGSAGNSTPRTRYDTIDKFPFSSDANAADVGNLTQARRIGGGTSSPTHGYTAGGYAPPGHTNIIDKFPFSVDGNAADVGDLTVARDRTAGNTSTTHGYVTAGGTFPPFTIRDEIDKYSIVSDANATDVGDTTSGHEAHSGQSSTTHGYISGGWAPGRSNVIEKFPFSSDGNSSDIADLTEARSNTQGDASSKVSGYTAGGSLYPNPPQPMSNVIDKFPFSSDANASDVGDLTQTQRGGGGQHV